MDLFPDRGHVRLRNRVLGTYLHADPDGIGISLRRIRASMSVAWAVHVYHDDQDNVYLLLQGAAYGLYLGSTGDLADPAGDGGHHGILVYQGHYGRPEFEDIMWQVVVSGDDVLLRHVEGGYLRANGKYRGWNDCPTVGDSDGRSMMMRWVVEPIPARQNIPDLPPPQIQEPHYITRVIQFVPASADGLYANDRWTVVQFSGNSILRLRNRIVNEMIREDPRLLLQWTSIVICVRAGRYARLSPMLVDLPRLGETLFIVVIRTRTPAGAQLRYPDINAE